LVFSCSFLIFCFFAFESAESTIAPCQHQHARDAEEHSKQNKHEGMVERVADDHGCGPYSHSSEQTASDKSTRTRLLIAPFILILGLK